MRSLSYACYLSEIPNPLLYFFNKEVIVVET